MIVPTNSSFGRRRFSRHCLLLLGLVFAIAPGLVRAQAGETASASPEAIEFFETKVRPVLADKCQGCHGERTQWSSFRLDSREALLEGGDNGPAVVVGDATESPLLARVISTDGDQMPPPGEGARLTEAEIEALTTWINSGVAWPASPARTDDGKAARDHWAFQPIKNPPVPDVERNEWARGAIDRFILYRLEEEGLGPAPRADRRTLIRRATYDLTGLPPTPEEVDAFVADESDDAYERLVDRLLASPAYGEHWGRHWLDVARYADSKGYVYSREEPFFVHSSLYRDWVVKAFNEDLPYDQFLLLQLAADQAAPDDPEAAAAMGFLTLGRRFLGVTPDIIDDRIDVVTRGTMGLTVSCARCHDHKFDPIPTADYYSLYGVFQNCAEVMRELPKPQQSPDEPEPPSFEAELAKRKRARDKEMRKALDKFSDLARQRVDEYLLAQWELDKYPALAFNLVLAETDVLPETVWRWQEYLHRAGKRSNPVFTPWTALAGLPREQFAEQAPAALAAVDLSPAATNPRVAEAFATPPKSVEELVDRYATLLKSVAEEWRELLADAKAQGLPAPTGMPDPADEQLRLVLHGEDSPCVIPDLPITNIEFFVDTKTCEKLWKLQGKVDEWIVKSPHALPHAVLLEDKPNVVNPRIFRRGNPIMLGDEVPLRFLEILSGPQREPFSQGSGRHELARAIVSPDNPLTSRVWVNRVWAHYFGEGLVRTPSDFGTRAEPPSHPELLDWLAHRFLTEGWSTKRLHREILLSATYQQNSHGAEEQATVAAYAAIDPENRLLWRQQVRRLSFEELRDTYLVVSGDLDNRLGGKGSNLFASTPAGYRRTLYALIDRQLLPSVLLNFDFANPDLHAPQRSETTVPQQALFSLNHMFVADRARSLVAELRSSTTSDSAEGVATLYRRILQRPPTDQEIEAAVRYLRSSEHEPADPLTIAAKQAWSYGYGEIDPDARRLRSFTPLPHFASTAWQGGSEWPSPDIGWAQITADGGHPGNDLRHAIVRRWTAPVSGTYRVTSTVKHAVAKGDGIRCWILSSRHGALDQAIVHNTDRAMHVDEVELDQGETLDFVVDILNILNNDQHQWAPEVSLISATPDAVDSRWPASWHAVRDFTTHDSQRLDPWEQFAQVLLISNEVMFVD